MGLMNSPYHTAITYFQAVDDHIHLLYPRSDLYHWVKYDHLHPYVNLFDHYLCVKHDYLYPEVNLMYLKMYEYWHDNQIFHFERMHSNDKSIRLMNGYVVLVVIEVILDDKYILKDVTVGEG